MYRFHDPLSILLILLLLGLNSCNKKIASSELPATQIIFGNGGGFVGKETAFALLEDGRIIALQRDSPTLKIVKKVGKKAATTTFALRDTLKLGSRLQNSPGNVYHFIILKTANRKDHKIAWDSGDPRTAPADLEGFYKKLIGFVSK